MKGKKVVTCQADENQRKPVGIALDERKNGIAQKADEQEEVEEGEYIIRHFFLGYS
jgi:DNA-directed RNA polymerase subunit K/omega